MISIIVPTYNENANIRKLILSVHETLKGHEHELIIVDDNSPDGTARTAEMLSRKYPVHVLKREAKHGLASAVVDGFKCAKGDILGVIDADMQHPPEYINDFVLAVSNGQDIAVGSRYVKGGKIEGWNGFRSFVSKSAILLSKPLTNLKDPMSGYFFIKRKVIEDTSLNPIGYKVLLEILVKGSYSNVKEIPYTFKLREGGESKLGIGEYINYSMHLYNLYGFKIKKMVYER